MPFRSICLVTLGRVTLGFALILTACHPAPRRAPQSQDSLEPLTAKTGPGSAGLRDALTGLRVENGRVRVAATAESSAFRPLNATDSASEVQSLLRQNRRREALDVALYGVQANPASPRAMIALSQALRRVGLLDIAAAAAQTAIDLAPRSLPAWRARAQSLDQSGKHGDALKAWQSVTALQSPPSRQVHRRLAALHHLLGNPTAAALHWQAADTYPPALPHHAMQKVSGPLRRVPVTVSPAVRIDTGGGTAQAAEVSLAASTDGVLVAAWNDLREAGVDGEWRLGWATSEDGGQTWTDDVLRPPGALPEDFEGDPMTAFDPHTGTLWVGGTQFFGDELFLSRRPAGATAFTPPDIVSTGTLDRAQLAVGPAPGQPQITLLHMAHISGLQTSADLGQTWGPIVEWQDFGFAHHPTMGPDGEVYVTYSDFAERILLQRSLDGGASLEPPVEVAIRLDTWDPQDGSRFPGQFRVAPLPYLASSPVDGTLYCVYFDTTEILAGQANVDLYLTRSTDRGLTWSPPAIANGDADPPGDQFHPWIEVDDSGRVHLVFFDTRHTIQDDDVEDGRIDVYHSVSDDAGTTWTETRLTSEPFGTAVIAWPVTLPQFLGDYLGLATAGDRTWVAYPTTENGDLDLFVREILIDDAIFSDGFESGTLTAWAGSAVARR